MFTDKTIWHLTPIFPIVVAYIILNLVGPQSGGTNEKSRFAFMQAMSDQNTFKINDYAWSVDWSKTPDGNVYSNKAPGPAFLAFPLFYIVDHIVKLFTGKKIVKKATKGWIRILLSMVFQLIPFGLVVILLAHYFKEKEDATNGALYFMSLAMLFGNTASLYMINFMGHGLTAIYFILLCISLKYQKYFYTGLLFGLLLLSEYSSAFLLPPIVAFIIYKNQKDFRWVFQFVLGGLFPGLLWCWYHYQSFGSIFKTSASYLNPDFIDSKDIDNNFLGVFSPYPRPIALFELLFGIKKGIFVTQPWILFLLFIAPIKILKDKLLSKESKEAIAFILLAFIFMLMMNASFGAWHAGNTSGPRYLSMVLPPFAIIATLLYPRLSALERKVLWSSLVIAIIVKWLTYVTTVNAPTTNSLWTYLITIAIIGYKKTALRTFVVVLVSVGTFSWIKKRSTKFQEEEK